LIGDPGIVPHHKLDLFAGDDVAVLLHVNARAGENLLAKRREWPGHRHQ
jgi:hypothetical protein